MLSSKFKILNSKFILTVIILTAVFFRFYQLDKFPPGLYADEAMNGNNALEALATGEFKVFYEDNQGREGLFINIQALFLKFLAPIFGNEPWILRLPSAIFGILTVLGVYFLAKELFNGYEIRGVAIALMSSFLMATSFWHINFSRIGFRAIMAPFLLVWSLYFLCRVLRITSIFRSEDRRNFQGLRQWLFLILGGILYGAGFHSYIAYRATPLFILAVFFAARKHYDIVSHSIRFLVFAGSALLVFLPLVWHFWENPQDFFGRTAGISIFQSPTPFRDLAVNIVKTAAMFNFVGDFNWRHNIAGSPLLFFPVGILFVVGLARGIYSSTQNVILRLRSGYIDLRSGSIDFLSSKILILWLLTAALPVVISNEGLPHALRSILMAPPVFILAGAGGVWIYEYLVKKFSLRYAMRASAVFVFLALFAVEAYASYFIRWGTNENTALAFNQDLLDIGRQINTLPPEIPKYVIYKTESGLPSLALQPVMFVTAEKNVFYIPKREAVGLPPDSNSFFIP